MKPEQLTDLIKKQGQVQKYSAGEIYHSQDFAEALYMLKSGYVKRYQVAEGNKRVIELIYGPSHIFPLTHLYKKMFNTDHNQDNLVYVYQAMSDIEIYRIGVNEIVEATDKDPKLFIDLFYEAGLRLRANINRLASNALVSDYQKVAHQLVSLADEFGKYDKTGKQGAVTILVPLEPVDMSEQLNISIEAADAMLDNLEKRGLITIKGDSISIPDLDMLKDAYL